MSLPLAFAVVLGIAGAVPLPTIDGKEAVAQVNGEPIHLDDYLQELADLHADAREMGQVVPKRDPYELLDRLVNVRLILQEAESIGLAELPEFNASQKAAERDALRAAVLDRAMEDVPAPKAAEIDGPYRERVSELQVTSVLFKTSADATAAAAGLATAADFVGAGRALVAAGRADTVEEPAFLRRKEMRPEVVRALDALEPGKVSPPFSVGPGFAVAKLVARRVPDDPATRDEVREELWGAKRAAAVRTFIQDLRKRRVKENATVLEALDFEADPKGFDRFLEDDRTVARIIGGEPIRVRDLAAALKKRFFHGVEQAGERKRLNKAKLNVLEQLTTEAAIQQEGKALGLDRTPEYVREMRDSREGLLFGLFVQKVVEPSVRIGDEDLKAYYDRHVADFTSPEMIRLESLTFADAAVAERALERLRAGADLAWMRANAEGQVKAESVPEDERFEGRLLTLASLPPEFRRALEGASEGDFRLAKAAGGHTHVIAVRDRVAARPSTLDEVRRDVLQRVFAEKRTAAIEEWTRKLREASEVKTFATSERLRELASERAGKVPDTKNK